MGAPGDCTATSTCPVQDGYFSSPPSLIGSGVFLVAFGLLIPANFFTGMRYNTPLYSSTLIAGLLFECVGYSGRVLLNANAASVSSFVVYMLGTVMGPAFVTSAVYQILPHVLVLYGREFALVSQPACLRVLFLVLDLLTLVFQAAGIALAVSGATQPEIARGINVLLAGLGLQLANIALFLAIYWYFVYKLHHRTYIVDSTFQDLYLSPKYKVFILCMQISTLLILTRTAVRLASLINGFSNPLNQSQPINLILDGALVLIASAILTSIPVGAVFRSAWSETAPHFPRGSSSSRSSGGRGRNGYRPANISLPVPPGGVQPLPAYSPGSPPYYPVGYSQASSPGHPLSPPLPTPLLHTFTPRSPPYHQLSGQGPLSPPLPTPPLHTFTPRSPSYPQIGVQQQQQQQQGPLSPPLKRFTPGQVVQQAPLMSPGFSPGRQQGFVQGHRRQQASTSLVNSEALW